MQITIPLFSGLSLRIATDSTSGEGYPTTRLQKGLLLIHGGQELTEEAVGFGVPVLMQGLQTIFPGDVELTSSRNGSLQEVTAVFKMNLKEKIARPGQGSVNSKLLYQVKDLLAALIRRFPLLRGLLTAASSGLRWMFGWETAYEEMGSCMQVKMIYAVSGETGRVNITVDTTGLLTSHLTEVIVMNEQGARYFDQYRDSSGHYLSGNQIGNWDEVDAEEASFGSSAHRVAFTLSREPGARLFRGRELIGSRLAWSGFGYSFPPTTRSFSYTVRIEKQP